MNKKKYITLTLMLFLLNIQPTSAACTQEEIREFKKVEDTYTVKYEFNKDTKDYTVYINKYDSKLYMIAINKKNDYKCEYESETLTKCSSVLPGEFSLVVVGKTETCDSILKSIKLTLPKYNSYSEDPLCEGIEEFVLCSPTYEKEINYETFVSRVKTYKRTKQDKSPPPTNDEQTNPSNETLDKIINYAKNNILEIIIVTIFIILVVVTISITAQSIRKSRRLE